MKYTNEELLKQAIEKYPINTIFKSAYSSEIFTVDSKSYSPRFTTNDKTILMSAQGCVYYNGKWAEIVSSPKLKEIYYEIY